MLLCKGPRRKQANNLNSQMPTALERSGDFSEFPTLVLKDPLTGLAIPGNKLRPDQINPVSLQLQNALCVLPTTSGTGVNTFDVVPFTERVDRYSFRLDHRISDKDQIRASYIAGLYGPNPSTGATSRFSGQSGIGERNMNTVLGWTHIFSPTLVGDLTAVYLHIPVYRTPQNVGTDFSSIIPGLGAQVIQGAPQINISNTTGVSEAGSKVLGQDIQLIGNLTKTLGSHNLKVGFSYLRDSTVNLITSAPQRRAFNFNGQYSGNAYADFLLGYPTRRRSLLPTHRFCVTSRIRAASSLKMTGVSARS